MDLIANKNRFNDSVGLRAQVFHLFESAESSYLKGRTIRTIGFSFEAGIGCRSSTLEAINDLTVEFKLWIFQPGENCYQMFTFFRKIRPTR